MGTSWIELSNWKTHYLIDFSETSSIEKIKTSQNVQKMAILRKVFLNASSKSSVNFPWIDLETFRNFKLQGSKNRLTINYYLTFNMSYVRKMLTESYW